VKILDDKKQRLRSWVGQQQGPKNAQSRSAGATGRQARTGVGGAAAHHQQVREQRHGLDRIKADISGDPFEQLALMFAPMRPIEALRMLEEPDDRVESSALVVCRALQNPLRTDPRSQILDQRADEAALANAGLTSDVDDRALTSLDQMPRCLQPGQLVIPAYQRRQMPGTRDVEPADRAGRSQHPMHAYAPRHPLQGLLAQRLGLDVALDEVARRVADHNGSRWGDRLKASGDVRHLPNNVNARFRVAVSHLSGNDNPAVQANPGLQRDVVQLAEVRVQVDELIEDPQPGEHPSSRIVLMRSGVAEIRNQTVADVPRDIAIEAFDGPDARLPITAEDLAEVLSFEQLGKRRGVHEVAEQHRHMPSLSSVPATGRLDHEQPAIERAATTAAEPHSHGALQTTVTARHALADPLSS
jgi:hypothetical protein